MLNLKRSSFWVIAVSIIIVIIAGIALITNPKQRNTIQSNDNTAESPSSAAEAAYYSEYNKVKIEFLSDMMGFKSSNKFETAYSPIVAYIDSTLRSSLTPVQEDDLNNNNIYQYKITLSDDEGAYSCRFYYDTLYDKAYIAKDNGLYAAGADFARYIDSFLENPISAYTEDADAIALFKTYGWTLDYQISVMNIRLNDIRTLTGFDPNAYYFAYNNELSKDIGLDMSGYSNTTGIEVNVYRIHESIPQVFYPIQDCRGIVVKNGGKIIGAFISAGRHSTFIACSLKGNSFEKAAGQALNEWLAKMIRADSFEERLSKLKPEQVIEEYFKALENKDAKAAEYCISKKTLLDSLSQNMLNDKLFNVRADLPLTDSDFGSASVFDNLKSIKLLKVELTGDPGKGTKVFRVTIDPQYNEEIAISNGERSLDCYLVYESPQTGWKVERFEFY